MSRFDRLRSPLEWAAAFLVLALWPLRGAARLLLRERRYSVWTGRPIITLGVKARSEALLGVRAISVVTQSYYITSAFDRQLASAASPRPWRYFVAWAALAWALVFARRVHTFYDAGFLPSVDRFIFNPRELWLYRVFGLQHVVWSYGADVRTRSRTQALGEPNCCTHCDAPGVHCICDEEKSRVNLQRIARGASMMATMGDMNEYVPLARQDLFYWPLDLAQAKFADSGEPPRSSGPLRVVHAPNHPQFKGSQYLFDAVEQLRAEGLDIELVRVERVPNDEALRLYRSADIVFDQCLIGFHGYFALEAMALGKPVMVFVRKPEYLLHPQECPLINVDRHSIASTLRLLASDRARLAELGRRGRDYVRRYYGPEAFAERLAWAYQAEGIEP